MASIRKLKNGNYQATIYVGRDGNGKMLRKYVTRQGWKECKNAAREIEEEIAQHDLSGASMMKMADWMEKWMNINSPQLSPTTRKAYRMYINKHFVPAFGKRRVCDITDLHIKSYIADKLSLGLSSTTVRKHYFTLRKIFREALKHKSPFFDMSPPELNNYRPRIPTEAGFKELHHAFAELGPEHEAVILLAGWCGMRRGEIFALKWDDINDKEGYIRVDEALALTEDDYRYEYKKPKSINGIRIIAAPDYLIKLLQEIKRAANKNEKSMKKKSKEDITHEIFSITPGSWTNLYSKIIKDKAFPKIRFHDLRHYHASVLYKNQVPDHYAAERLGHDIWVLKKIYQHLGLEEKRDLDDKIKKMFT